MEPSSGTCVLAEDKTAMIYSPPSNPLFIRQTKFEYEACLDDVLASACDRASVTISVKAPIIVRDDIVSVLSMANVTRIGVLQKNFTNPPGQQLIVKEITMEPSSASGTCILAKDKTTVIYSLPFNLLFIRQTKFEYETCMDDGLELACDRTSVASSVEAPIITRNDIVSVLSTSNETL